VVVDVNVFIVVAAEIKLTGVGVGVGAAAGDPTSMLSRRGDVQSLFRSIQQQKHTFCAAAGSFYLPPLSSSSSTS